MVGIGEMSEKTVADLTSFWGYLGEPDDRFNGLYLAEERTNVAELMVPPINECISGGWLLVWQFLTCFVSLKITSFCCLRISPGGTRIDVSGKSR